MAKGGASTPAPAHSVPAPPAGLDKLVSRMTWPATKLIHRIHPGIYGAAVFNPGLAGDARFSPIKDKGGNLIPTIYGGDTFDCAAMETIFHDVPFSPGLKTVRKAKLRGSTYSQLLAPGDLVLADLRGPTLRKLGITRTQLIETEKDQYPGTRLWAEAIHAACPDIQGLCWISRQDARAEAIIIFEDRFGPSPLLPQAPSLDVLTDAATFADVIALADLIGVKLYGK